MYPAGLSASLFALGGGSRRRVSRRFLLFLVAPLATAVAAVGLLQPEMLELRGAPVGFLALAVAAAPAALAVELAVHGLAGLRATGRFPRGLALDRFWGADLAAADHLVLAAVVVGEEMVYRQLWLLILVGAFGMRPLLALALSSVFYGLNHLHFGAASVVSKALVGLIHGGLFLAAGASLWPPLVSHGLSNLLIFRFAGRGDG